MWRQRLRWLSVTLLCLPVVAVQAQQAWYMESSMLLLEPSNRYVATVVATNPTPQPVYLRASTTALLAQDGRRERAPDSGPVLSVYPAEFVLHPNSSFAVRVVADARKLEGTNRSFYLKLRDVSNLVAEGAGSAMATSTLLAHEVLVSVGARNAATVKPDMFVVRRDDQGQWRLSNRSGQHVYLQGGYGCDNAQQSLNSCNMLRDFPRQSAVMDEELRIPAPNAPFLGVLLKPSLSQQSLPQALLIPVPP